MTKGELDYAKQIALMNFDLWNDITGVPNKHCSWYYEIKSIIEDAVDIGARVACGEDVKLSDYVKED